VVHAAAGDVQAHVGAELLPLLAELDALGEGNDLVATGVVQEHRGVRAISPSLLSRRRPRHSGISSTLGSVRSEARMYRGPNSAACRTVERRSHAIRAAAIGVR